MRFVFLVALCCASYGVCAQDEPSQEEAKKWEKSVAVGVTITDGNSETLLSTANITGQRKSDRNEISLSLSGTYGESDGVKNNESVEGSAQYNQLTDEKWYYYGRAVALHDGIADIDYRFTLGPGAGYYFLKNPEKITLSSEIGPSFVYEKAGGDATGYIALRIGEDFKYKINERARFWQSLEFLPQVDDPENFLLNFTAGIETSITEKLKLRVYVEDKYDNQPAPGRESNDVKLVTQLAYNF